MNTQFIGIAVLESPPRKGTLRILNRPGSWHLYGIVISLPKTEEVGGRERREGLILSEESSLHHTGGGLSGRSRESKCPQHGILRDCNARGRNLAGKGGAGHFREGAGS